MTFVLRAAQPTDAGRIGEILWENTRDAPDLYDLFSCAEAIACCGQMIDRGWVTVAEREGQVEAFLARDETDVEALYSAASAARQGLGAVLVTEAQKMCDQLQLNVHAANAGARRFYRRLGFVETETGPQAVHMTWTRETSI
ncbi:MAG: N-acetyltransferase family protein [Paracoccaceae bacterium]